MALSLAVVWPDIMLILESAILGANHAACLEALMPAGAIPKFASQLCLQENTCGSGGLLHRLNSKSCRVVVPIAEDRKEGRARSPTRLTPSPPSLTGRLAWPHCESERVELVIME